MRGKCIGRPGKVSRVFRGGLRRTEGDQSGGILRDL